MGELLYPDVSIQNCSNTTEPCHKCICIKRKKSNIRIHCVSHLKEDKGFPLSANQTVVFRGMMSDIWEALFLGWGKPLNFSKPKEKFRDDKRRFRKLIKDESSASFRISNSRIRMLLHGHLTFAKPAKISHSIFANIQANTRFAMVRMASGNPECR